MNLEESLRHIISNKDENIMELEKKLSLLKRQLQERY